MDFKAWIARPEYDFLRTEPRLGRRILLLGVSGSYGYGTNRADSDVDLRGVTAHLPSDLIGLTSFEQYEDRATDTVIYGFQKFVSLLLNCNPNIIELLGLDEEQYLIKTPAGQALLDNRHLFLSKRAAYTFGRFADAQKRRLQNAVARDTLPQREKEGHVLNSAHYAMEDFLRRHRSWDGAEARLYLDRAETEGLEQEIYLDAALRHIPLRSFNELMNTLTAVVRDYDRQGKQRRRKDENHLNKHAMHLIRLYMTSIDLLERGEIVTRRPEAELTLLRSIRAGDYLEQGAFSREFDELVADYEGRFRAARKSTRLPEEPDMAKIEQLVEQINRAALEGDSE